MMMIKLQKVISIIQKKNQVKHRLVKIKVVEKIKMLF